MLLMGLITPTYNAMSSLELSQGREQRIVGRLGAYGYSQIAFLEETVGGTADHDATAEETLEDGGSVTEADEEEVGEGREHLFAERQLRQGMSHACALSYDIAHQAVHLESVGEDAAHLRLDDRRQGVRPAYGKHETHDVRGGVKHPRSAH